MNDVRHDPVTGRVVIVAADRAARPHTLVQASSGRGSRPRALPVLPRARVRDAARDRPHRTRRTRGAGLAGAGVPEPVPDHRRTRGRRPLTRPPPHLRPVVGRRSGGGLHGAARPRPGASRRRAALRHRNHQPGSSRRRVDRAPARTGLRSRLRPARGPRRDRSATREPRRPARRRHRRRTRPRARRHRR